MIYKCCIFLSFKNKGVLIMHIGYKRVSTQEQTTARQLVGVELERVYEEKASGATKNRPELERCLDALRAGDTLHVHSVDRLSRSMRDLLDIVDQVLKSGSSLIIYSPRLEFTSQKEDYLQTFQLQLWGIVSQMERAMSRERQREGTAIAKEKGTRSGKPWGKPPLDMSRSSEAIRLLEEGRTISSIASAMKLSRGSIYKLLSGHTKQVTY